jgi:hypothetical protein
MKKLMITALVASCAVFAQAQETAATAPAQAPAVECEGEECEEESLFEFGFDASVYTAYVWRNQVYNDRPVAQPCVWADFIGIDPFYFGFYIWQNYDLTNRRREEMRGEWNETDYNIHLGATIWSDEEETMALTVEVGHEWFVNNVKSEHSKDYASTCEIYVKAEFENPFVTPYGTISHAYRYIDYTHYELGLKRDFVLLEEMSVGESLTLGLDWNVNFGNGKALDSVYGVGRGYYEDDEGEGDFFRGNKDGIGGTTIKATLTWQICECFSIGGVIAYTSLLNESIRENYRDSGWYGNYKDDFVWGGFQANLSF